MVKLLDIIVAQAEIDLYKSNYVLKSPILDLSIDVSHKPNNINTVDFNITHTFETIELIPILKVTTRSVFEVEKNKSAFHGEIESRFLDLLSHLANDAFHHNQAILSFVAKALPISRSSLFGIRSPNDFRQMIVDELRRGKQ